MRLTLTALVRSIAVLAIGSTIVALGVSRAVPTVSPAAQSVEAPPRFFGVNGSIFVPQRERNYLLDTESGELRDFELPHKLTFDYASCSPTRGEHEDFLFVGRMTMRTGGNCETLCGGSGLGWVGLGNREVIGQISLNTLPTGFPCWLPGTPRRVVFPAGDGHLYLQALNPDDSSDGEGAGAGDRLTRLDGWDSAFEGNDRAIIADVVRPVVPGLGGRLFVSINPPLKAEGQARFGRSEIWWLALNAEATRIEAAGKLIEHVSKQRGESPAEERLPNLIATPDGRIALAYLRRRSDSGIWSLQLAPVRIDAKTGIPSVSAAESREVASDSAVTMPAFSPDGRSLFCVPRTLLPGEAAQRISVVDVLGRNSKTSQSAATR